MLSILFMAIHSSRDRPYPVHYCCLTSTGIFWHASHPRLSEWVAHHDEDMRDCVYVFASHLFAFRSVLLWLGFGSTMWLPDALVCGLNTSYAPLCKGIHPSPGRLAVLLLYVVDNERIL